jgi:hypothetical protein
LIWRFSWPIGPAKAQYDTGEYVAERALQRESQDNGNDPRGRQHALDGQVEHIANNGKQGGQVNHLGEQVVSQSAFVRWALDKQEGMQNLDQKPRGPQPPRNLQNGVYDVADRRAGRLQWLVGNDISAQQKRSAGLGRRSG